MSAIATAHQPWCTDHQNVDAEEGMRPYCCRVHNVAKSGAGVELAQGADGEVEIMLWEGSPREVSAEEAVTLAVELVEAACIARGERPSTVAVARNLTRIIGSHGPLDVDAVEIAATALGLDVAEILTKG